MFSYTWYQWLLFFFLYCFIGWCFESTVVSVSQRRFVNRGFLRGPLLPIYGFGACIILYATLPVENNIILTFLHGMVAATLLELVTGYVMEQLFKVRYWDYSKKPFNFHGYISLTSSLCWGFLSIILTDVVHYRLESLVLKIPVTTAQLIALTILLIFLIDVYHSAKAALDMRKVLEQMTEIKKQIALQEEEFREKMESRIEVIQERNEILKEHLQEYKEIRQKVSQNLKEDYQKLLEIQDRYRRALLENNPSAISEKFSEALEEIKAYLKKEKTDD